MKSRDVSPCRSWAIRAAAFTSLLAFGACSREPSPDTSPGAPSGMAPAVVTPPPSAPAPVASAAPKVDDAKAVVERWNALHSARDARGLEGVYADTVDFYGQKVRRERVLELKRAALDEAPEYVQSLEAVRLTTPGPGLARAEFTKSWTQRGKTSSTSAALELRREERGFRITKETDGPSEAKRARAGRQSTCEDAVGLLVMNTEPAKGLLATPMPAGSPVTMGSRIMGGPAEGEPTFAVAIHENHPDRLATLAWFDVDPKTGVMKADDKVIPTDPALSKKVREACAR